MILFGSNSFQTVSILPRAWGYQEAGSPAAGPYVVTRDVWPCAFENPDFDPTVTTREPAAGFFFRAYMLYTVVAGAPVVTFVLQHFVGAVATSLLTQILVAGTVLEYTGYRLPTAGYVSLQFVQSVGAPADINYALAWSITTV